MCVWWEKICLDGLHFMFFISTCIKMCAAFVLVLFFSYHLCMYKNRTDAEYTKTSRWLGQRMVMGGRKDKC
ncbi:hypothetical protein GE21DRAFT_1054526 [Neurospora crassa]|nr:hypothetical protein GE21DRAFT_1054526 [Neurospora crassa]